MKVIPVLSDIWSQSFYSTEASFQFNPKIYRGHGTGPGGGTRVHHGRVGSAGLCDLKILHPWRRLKKGVKILQWPPPPPTLEKGGQYSTSVWKVCKKRGSKIYNSKKNRGQNSTSLKMGVKILHAEKKGSKFYNAWKKGVNILHPTPKVEVKILHRLKKGGQKGRAYPLPKI